MKKLKKTSQKLDIYTNVPNLDLALGCTGTSNGHERVNMFIFYASYLHLYLFFFITCALIDYREKVKRDEKPYFIYQIHICLLVPVGHGGSHIFPLIFIKLKSVIAYVERERIFMENNPYLKHTLLPTSDDSHHFGVLKLYFVSGLHQT